jgi:NADH-quinone oxidoreductase subunit L
VHMTFHGSFRGTHEQEHHLHESPKSMTVALQILAVGSIVTGFFGVGFFGMKYNLFERFVHPVAAGVEIEGHHVPVSLEVLLIVLSVAVALSGIWLATRFYHGAHAFEAPRRFAERFPALYQTVANKYYVDEAYDTVVVRPLEKTAWFSWKWLDTVAVDGTLNALAFLTEITGDLLRFLQTGNVRNYALMVLAGALAAVALMVL